MKLKTVSKTLKMEIGFFQTNLFFSNADAVQFSANRLINAMWRDAIQEFDKIANVLQAVLCRVIVETRLAQSKMPKIHESSGSNGLTLSWESCSIEYIRRRKLYIWWDISTASTLFTFYDKAQGCPWWVIDAQTWSVTLSLQHTSVRVI